MTDGPTFSDASENAIAADESPLSLARLQDAFKLMLGGPGEESEPPSDTDAPSRPDSDAVTPEGIVEALLFVGRPDDAPRSAEEIAEAIRDVSAAEVEAIVERLDAAYEWDGAAWRVDRSTAGYRLKLAAGLERVGDRLRGKVRATRLSQPAMETLAVVAYRQPISGATVDELRGQKCAAALKQLVRQGLVARREATETQAEPAFVTTDRFLRVFELASVDQLPRVAELDD